MGVVRQNGRLLRMRSCTNVRSEVELKRRREFLPDDERVALRRACEANVGGCCSQDLPSMLCVTGE